MYRIAFIFGILFILELKSNDAVVFKLTNLQCASYNQSWLIVNNCRLKVIKRNTIAAYVNATILHPVNDLFVHYEVLKRANGYKPWIMKGKVDACRFLKIPYDLTLKWILPMFIEFTTFNHSCPYNGTQLVHGFYPRPELLHLPFPTGDYKAAIGWYFDRKLQGDSNYSFTFVENIIDQ